ncbi:MAG: hypothetical protein VCD33_05865 [Alphaproteobacteria bacterium]
MHEDAADETAHKVYIGGCTDFSPGGCAGQELSSVEGLETSGSAFDKALYAEYLDRSSMEYAEGDYGNSDLFAIKARSAAAGEDVGPVVLEDHMLAATAVGELSQARRELSRR